MVVLAISGSLRGGSYNTMLLGAAASAAPRDVRLVQHNALALVPPYDEDADVAPTPPAVRSLREQIASADALLVATPEYNGSVPGQLKNALDWASRPFPDSVLRNKPVAVIGASTGMFGAVWATQDLRRILGVAGARLTDGQLVVPRADEEFDPSGRLRDPSLERALEKILLELATEATVGVAL